MVAELEPRVESVSWRLNDVGRATFVLSVLDAKATEAYLRFGNRVYLTFDNGLPPWGGVIDPPRVWRGDGTVEIAAYSGEYILGFRQTDRGRYFSAASVGYIFSALINEANSVWNTDIAVGDVWAGGDGHFPSYHFANLLKKMKDSLCSRLSSADFAVLATESGGAVSFAAHLYERRGLDRNGVVLLEGKSLAGFELMEQGPIINSWDVAGKGSGWGGNRPTAHAQNDVSISIYGLREGFEMHSDTEAVTSLQAIADNLLGRTAYPRNILTVEAVNVSPALYSDYDVGDRVRVIAPSYGFAGYDEMVRVLTREYRPESDLCSLVVEEQTT